MGSRRSAGVAEASADAVDGGGDGAVEFGGVGFAVFEGCALAADEFDLQEAHGGDVGVAVWEGFIFDQGGVEAGYAEVGFDEGHFYVADDVDEEGEVAHHGLEKGEAV